MRFAPAAFAPIILLLLSASTALAQPGGFAIWKGQDLVGQVRVDRRVQGERVLYAMTSYSEVMAVWKRIVRTSVATEYLQGQLVRCHSSLRVDRALKDSSHLDLRGLERTAYLHPGRKPEAVCANPWSTARMYYEEPVGQMSVYVESVLADCPLLHLGEGLYRLTLPGGKVNEYVYHAGVLQEIRVLRTLFDLVFRRVS